MSENKGFLYARLRGTSAQYRFIGEWEHLICFPTEAKDAVPYLPSEDDQNVWYYLEGVDPSKMELPPDRELVLACDRLDLDTLLDNQLQYLAFEDNDGHVMYQVVYGAQVLKQQHVLSFDMDGSADVRKDDGGNVQSPYVNDSISRERDRVSGIILINVPDAIYDRNTGRFCFRRLRKLYSSFPWLISVYKEIESKTIEEFLSLELVQFSKGLMNAKKVGRYNICRLRKAGQIVRSFSEDERKRFDTYVKTMFPMIYFDEQTGIYSVESDTELRNILYCIEQKCYISPVTGEKRIAQSVLKIDRD